MKLLVMALLAAGAAWAQQCSYVVTPRDSLSVAPGGGSGSFGVASGPGCTWTGASTDPSWLKIVFGQTGTGNGTVGWSADASKQPTARSAQLLIAGQTFTVTQAAQTCSYTLLPSTASVSLAVSGGTGVFQVKSNCNWQPAPSQTWITATFNLTDGTVNYTVAPNPCVAARSGFITVGDQRFQISQTGSDANLAITPAQATLPLAGGSGAISVSTGAGCAWTATTQATWVQLTTSATAVQYMAAANAGAQRTALIAIGPKTFQLTQTGVAPPTVQITSIVNSANYAQPPVAPGEIVTIFGQQMGPPVLVTPQLTPDGRSLVKILSGTRVLFDGTPAAMIYTRDDQVSAVVPYAVAGQSTTGVQVEYNGTRSAAQTVAVQTAAPAIFTLDQTGNGAGAILNQDYFVNGPANAAARGSVIQIYCTGAGVTNPMSVDAQLTGSPLPLLVLPASVTIGGADAKVWYAGAAPDAVAGLTQVNAEIPAGVTPGTAVPVKIRVGDRDTQDGVTVAVK